MHSGDITTDLVADGYSMNMLPWTRNDLVIVGPPSDPEKIKGLRSGVEAFRRIAAAQAPYLDAFNKGGRELSHTLWTKAGVTPPGKLGHQRRGQQGQEHHHLRRKEQRLRGLRPYAGAV